MRALIVFLTVFSAALASAGDVEEMCVKKCGAAPRCLTYCLEKDGAAKARLVGRKVQIGLYIYCDIEFPDSYALAEICLNYYEANPGSLIINGSLALGKKISGGERGGNR